jgi:hypothetical protein
VGETIFSSLLIKYICRVFEIYYFVSPEQKRPGKFFLRSVGGRFLLYPINLAFFFLRPLEHLRQGDQMFV